MNKLNIVRVTSQACEAEDKNGEKFNKEYFEVIVKDDRLSSRDIWDNDDNNDIVRAIPRALLNPNHSCFELGCCHSEINRHNVRYHRFCIFPSP